MRKIKTTQLIILIFFGLFLFYGHTVHADIIRNFDSQIIVNNDSSILVTETIKYDFENNEKHGIYRDIPIKYNSSNGKSSILFELKNILVDGQNDEYLIVQDGDNRNIRIGKSDVLIKGEHTYVITYKIEGAINYFKNFDELYWNMTGNSWQIPIENFTSSIKLPEGVDMTKIQSSCYIGVLGSKESCDLSIDGNYIKLKSSRYLKPKEGITIAVGFSKGLVSEPTKLFKILSFVKNNVIFLLPILVFIVMFLIWRKYGKDPEGYSTIIAQYEPPHDMKPTLLGALADEKVDIRDITAGLIYLAEQGYVKIIKVEEKGWIFSGEDYQIELLRDDLSSLDKIENDILYLYFENINIGEKVNISSFKKDVFFKKKINSLINYIYEEMANRGFYEKNPSRVKMPYIIAPIIILSIAPALLNLKDFISILPIVLSCLIIFLFGYFMSKTTNLGAETRDHILGFKDFLKVTEQDRLNFHNSPDKNPEKFMEFLPYAIALGVEKEWAKKFEDVYLEQPSWYSEKLVGAFLITDFASQMSDISESFNTAAGSQSGSGGGGGSGGGRGGGGGGSW